MTLGSPLSLCLSASTSLKKEELDEGPPSGPGSPGYQTHP